MSWICPFCGTENYLMPLNSRHDVLCKGCGERYISPDDLEAQIRPQIIEEEKFFKIAMDELQDINDHISSLTDELSSWNLKRKDALAELENTKAELDRLRGFVVHREADRTAKIQADKYQTRILV